MTNGFTNLQRHDDAGKYAQQEQLFSFDQPAPVEEMPDDLLFEHNESQIEGYQEQSVAEPEVVEEEPESVVEEEAVHAAPAPATHSIYIDDSPSNIPTNLDAAPDERRWAWAEIDLDCIKHNIKAIRKLVSPEVQIMAVVKANGYGHGAVEVAKAALSSGANYLGVATADEGIELRQANIASPILILSEPPRTAIPLLLKHDLITTVCSAEFAIALGEAADAAGLVAPYHLKVDTGMNRIGVRFNEAVELLKDIEFHRAIELQGVFTHFATAEAAEPFEFKKQMDKFTRCVENIRRHGFNPGIVHAANSAATIRYKKSHFNMVRVGISMYGLHPAETTIGKVKLQPAMSIKARVTQVKPVTVGEGVSYNHTYRSPGNVLIATLPIGYGDGLPRALSNRMQVLLNGRSCPQIGNICMDMCMFEADQRATLKTPKVDVAYGDVVTIVGKDNDQQIQLDDLAKRLGTINYELACCFGLRLQKVYKNG
jgi:alanine racemase